MAQPHPQPDYLLPYTLDDDIIRERDPEITTVGMKVIEILMNYENVPEDELPVSKFQNSDVLFEITDPKSGKIVYVAKVLTEREYKITNYLKNSVDSICASYLALPIEILVEKITLASTNKTLNLYVMISPLFGISEMSDDLRSKRVQSFQGENAIYNQFIPGLKRLMLFRAAMGLYCIHKEGIIHADIKNDNYFGQDVLLGDFGLSYREGMGLGRKVLNYESWPPYIYEEDEEGNVTIRHDKANQAADIWGFGLMALQWFTSPEVLKDIQLFGVALGKEKEGNTKAIKPNKIHDFITYQISSWFKMENEDELLLVGLLREIFYRCPNKDTCLSMANIIRHPYFAKLKNDPDYALDYEIGLMYVNSNEPDNTAMRAKNRKKGILSGAMKNLKDKMAIKLERNKNKKDKIPFSQKPVNNVIQESITRGRPTTVINNIKGMPGLVPNPSHFTAGTSIKPPNLRRADDRKGKGKKN